MNRIYPDEAVPVLESVGVSLFLGFTVLPLSAGHFLSNLGDQAVIQVGGRPNLFLIEILVSLLVFVGMVFFVIRGYKWAGLIATIYMLIAAPYWAYYSFALIGI